jgi:hypothetical protein
VAEREELTPLPPTLPQPNAMPRPFAGNDNSLLAWRMAAPPEPAPPLPAPPASINNGLPTDAPYPYSVVFGEPLPAEALPFAEAVVTPSEPPAAGLDDPAPLWANPLPPRSDEASGSMALAPVLMLNGVFDALSYLLGPLGAWLRRPAGRKALGWSGVAMIFGAACWAAVEWYAGDWTR